MKPILMVLAPINFRDEELFNTKIEIENAGFKTVLASIKEGECVGANGGKAFAGIDIDQVISSDYEAVVFVGGNGSKVYFSNKTVHQIAKEMCQQGKIVSAICIAPVILGEAQLLNDKKVTAHESEIDTFKKYGAIYTGETLTQDGQIIICSGPAYASLFGKAIAREIKRFAKIPILGSM